MPTRRESKRLALAKRNCEDSPDDSPKETTLPDRSVGPAKRQRIDVPQPASLVPEEAPDVDIPDATLQVYRHMLPRNPKGIAFLFDASFSDALENVEDVAIAYHVHKDDAIEELRRLLVIKALTGDEDANEISPTPLSKKPETINSP